MTIHFDDLEAPTSGIAADVPLLPGRADIRRTGTQSLRPLTGSTTAAPAAPTTDIAIERFDDLGLLPPLLRALAEESHVKPTAIQAQAIPAALLGRDILGCAQTGTGKTAAFVLPILQRLASKPPAHGRRGTVRALILSPTRELASQIGRALQIYGRHLRLTGAVVYGGVAERQQTYALRKGVDVLVATPGRLCDLMSRGLVRLEDVEIFVLDEADRMLDEGFLPDVGRVLDVMPRERQTLLFSATMPAALRPLADQILTNPVAVQVQSLSSTPTLVAQSLYYVEEHDKAALLEHLMADETMSRAIVFTKTRQGADGVADALIAREVKADSIHGEKSQREREAILARFRRGSLRVLVATDVAARGIDVSGVSHVVNFDLPMDPEAYVHRIGRTARAGASGAAMSFCGPHERRHLANIERLIRQRIPVNDTHPFAPPGGVGPMRSHQRSGGGGRRPYPARRRY
jgi:ATP-dependent RNA helicase RhlE